MKVSQALIPVAIVLAATSVILLKQSPFFVAVAVLLWGGVVLEPFRVYQSLSGRLMSQAEAGDAMAKKAARAFLWAIPFWLGVLWAFWSTVARNQCSGDNCIGHTLGALPFPFLYGRAEYLLYVARRQRSRQLD
jgi:hypothetical protein